MIEFYDGDTNEILLADDIIQRNNEWREFDDSDPWVKPKVRIRPDGMVLIVVYINYDTATDILCPNIKFRLKV